MLKQQDFYNVDRMRQKQGAMLRKTTPKMPVRITIPDDSMGDLSMDGGGLRLRESLISTDVKMGKNRGMYEPPTALRASIMKAGYHPSTPTGTGNAGKMNPSQDEKTPEPKSALVPP